MKNISICKFLLFIFTIFRCAPSVDNTGALAKIAFIRLTAASNVVSKVWTRILGGNNSTAYGTAVVADSNGNYFATGYTNGTFDDLSLTGNTDIFLVKYDTNGDKQWSKLLGVSGALTYSYGIAIDSSDNPYITGSTQGNLDGQTITGDQDLFLSKYDNSGNKQWTKLLGVSGLSTTARGITVDSSANVYVTGSTEGSLDGQTLIGNIDTFLVKYDSSGNKQWTKLLGVSASSTIGSDVIHDTDGNIYLVGYTNGNLNGESKTGTNDIFIVKYDGSGNLQWTKLIGASNASTYGYKISADTSSNIYALGCSTDNIDGQTSTGSKGTFATKYDSSGNQKWIKMLNTYYASTSTTSSSSDSCYSSAPFYGDITNDSNANVFITDSTTVSVDDQTLTGTADVYIAKYNSKGNKSGNLTLLGASGAETRSYGITVDTNGKINIVGFTKGNLDGNTLIGTQDFFTSKFQ